jgi:probable phosphoglycerate mutase
MKLYLARHSETTYNVQQILNSDPNNIVHLTELGIAQSQKLADDLRDVPFDVIYVSEFARTQETAEIINAGREIPMIIDARLNENGTGYEGIHTSEWRKAMADSGDMWNVSFNGGESLGHAYERIAEFLRDLESKSYTYVLIVAHGFGVQALFGQIEHKSNDEAWKYFIRQGEFEVFELEVSNS